MSIKLISEMTGISYATVARALSGNGYCSKEKRDIIAKAAEEIHYHPTLSARTLRNNRTDERYPDGIFHVHPEYMNIKSESIGLIEAMGMFILPARLDRELAEVAKVLEGKRGIADDIAVHREMTERLLSEYGNSLGKEEAWAAVKRAVDGICEHILENTAVFKEDARGEEAFEAFVKSCLIKQSIH